MHLDHERLDVYQLSLDFLILAERLIRAPIPPALKRLSQNPMPSG
jgi:hypothetical protein